MSWSLFNTHTQLPMPTAAPAQAKADEAAIAAADAARAAGGSTAAAAAADPLAEPPPVIDLEALGSGWDDAQVRPLLLLLLLQL